jgi:hypothetical protein
MASPIPLGEKLRKPAHCAAQKEKNFGDGRGPGHNCLLSKQFVARLARKKYLFAGGFGVRRLVAEPQEKTTDNTDSTD